VSFTALSRFLHKKCNLNFVLRKLWIVPHMWRTNFNKSYRGQVVELIGNFKWYLTQQSNILTSISWMDGVPGCRIRWGSIRNTSSSIALLSWRCISFNWLKQYVAHGRNVQDSIASSLREGCQKKRKITIRRFVRNDK